MSGANAKRAGRQARPRAELDTLGTNSNRSGGAAGVRGLHHEPFIHQRIGAEVRRMRRLGMTLQAIGKAFGVDEKTARNVLRIL